MNKITIDDISMVENRITNNVSVSKHLKKYFHSFRFETAYDGELTDNESILNIPVVSALLPVAWITGADVHVKKIDKTYLEAVNLIQRDFKTIFPKGPFRTELMAEEQVDNRGISKTKGYALTFSGGVDSTYSMIHNINLNPMLIMIFGADMALSKPEEIEKVRKCYLEFAAENGLSIHFITTNAREGMNMRRMTHDFHDVLGGHFWGKLEQGMFHIGMIAPLSMGRFDNLLVASSKQSRMSLTDPKQIPDGSIPCISEKMSWANLKVQYDGVIPRHEKIRLMKEYMKDHRMRFRVCLGRISENCNTCNKCLRTMFSLMVAGIDPNICGFSVNEKIFELLKNGLQQKKMADDIEHDWKRLQKAIPEQVEEIIPGLSEFCKWLKTYDLEQAKDGKSKLISIYYKIPFEIGKLLHNQEL